MKNFKWIALTIALPYPIRGPASDGIHDV